MKRYGKTAIIFGVVMAVLGLVGAGAITAQWDDVFVTCNGLEGDLQLVEGVSFATTNRYEDLAWDLEMPLTAPQDMTVQMHQEETNTTNEGDFHLALYDSSGFHGQFDRKEEHFSWQQEAIWAVIDRTAPGETREETVELGQYDPYFYLDGTVYFAQDGETHFAFRDGVIAEIAAYINLSTQGYQATIQVTKDPEGNAIAVEFDLVGDAPKPTLMTQGFDNVGYAYLERTPERGGEIHAMTFGENCQLVTAKQLATLPPEFDCNNFFNDGKNLLCQGEDGLYVYPLDTGAGYFLEDFQPGWWNCFVQKDALYFGDGGKFQLYTLENGRYTLYFCGEFESSEQYHENGYYYVDGTAYYLTRNADYSQFTIQAMAKDGRHFSGDYSLSQSQEVSYINPNGVYVERESHGPGNMQ